MLPNGRKRATSSSAVVSSRVPAPLRPAPLAPLVIEEKQCGCWLEGSTRGSFNQPSGPPIERSSPAKQKLRPSPFQPADEIQIIEMDTFLRTVKTRRSQLLPQAAPPEIPRTSSSTLNKETFTAKERYRYAAKYEDIIFDCSLRKTPARQADLTLLGRRSFRRYNPDSPLTSPDFPLRVFPKILRKFRDKMREFAPCHFTASEVLAVLFHFPSPASLETALDRPSLVADIFTALRN